MSRISKEKEDGSTSTSKGGPGQQFKQPNFGARKASLTPGGNYQSDGFKAVSQKVQQSANLGEPPKSSGM